MIRRFLYRAIVMIVILLLVLAPEVNAVLQNGNPSHTVIRAKLKEMALKYNIPSVIFMSIAYTESGWRQFDVFGNPVLHTNTDGSFDIGIMQINSSGRSDIEKLKTDIFYNIEIGAKILDGKWKITPGVGDRDRNVLENWYYAIWAYNGFSYTNHPANPAGRRYQEKVLDNLARLIIGDDGQPLWMPINISRPDPLSISNPPQWIPTPTPYHFGDLYTGLYEGDNFRLLQAADSPVVSANSEINLGFKVENIGTTTWKNSANSVYIGRLTIESQSKAQTFETALNSVTEPGGKCDFAFKILLPEEGIYRTTFRMFKGDMQFGQSFIGNIIAKENALTYSIAVQSEYKFGEEIPVDFLCNTNFSVNLTLLEHIIDSSGNEIYRSTVPMGSKNRFSYFVGEGISSNGTYTLRLEVFLNAGSPSFTGSEISSPYYAVIDKQFTVNDPRTGAFINSSIQGASISVNGQATAFTTPSFLELQNGIYSITLAKEGFNPLTFDLTINVGIISIYQRLESISPAVELSNASLDFGAVYKGNSFYRSLALSLSSPINTIGTVRTSAKWIFVYPLSFTNSSDFTISFDSRFLDEGATLSGTIYFNANGNDYPVNVYLTTLFSTSVLSFSPSSLTAREDDSIYLDINFLRNNASPQNIHFETVFDSAYVSFVDFAKGESVNVDNFSSNGNNLIFDISFLLEEPETKILTIQFRALKTTLPMSSSLKFSSGYIIEDGVQKDMIFKNAELKILEKLILPNPVMNISGEGLINKVKLHWNIPSSGSYPVKEFEVYRAETVDFNTVFYIGSAKPSSDSFEDPGPLLNKPYYYWVITVDNYGNSSIPAGPVEMRPLYQTQNLPAKVKIEFYIGKTTSYVNGIVVKMEVAPFIQEGRTYVPVRYVAQPFGAQVIWNAKERKVTLIHKNLIELWIGNPVASINGLNVPIDKDNPNILPFIIEGRTMLPLRFVSESFGAEVSWDALLKKVTIEYTTTK